MDVTPMMGLQWIESIREEIEKRTSKMDAYINEQMTAVFIDVTRRVLPSGELNPGK